mgnify:CR=1 FL=1
MWLWCDLVKLGTQHKSAARWGVRRGRADGTARLGPWPDGLPEAAPTERVTCSEAPLVPRRSLGANSDGRPRSTSMRSTPPASGRGVVSLAADGE